MTKIFYDCEFVEDGASIDLVSIGMVADDGRELYAVSSDVDQAKLLANPWLRDNVWPHLPRVFRRCRCRQSHHGHLDLTHPDVRPRAQIARLVADFITATPQVELWANYGAYDHVALCWLWGPMSALPAGVPMYTCDLQQEARRLGNPAVPKQAAGAHNALADARHNQVIAAFLADVDASRARV